MYNLTANNTNLKFMVVKQNVINMLPFKVLLDKLFRRKLENNKADDKLSMIDFINLINESYCFSLNNDSTHKLPHFTSISTITNVCIY